MPSHRHPPEWILLALALVFLAAVALALRLKNAPHHPEVPPVTLPLRPPVPTPQPTKTAQPR